MICGEVDQRTCDLVQLDARGKEVGIHILPLRQIVKFPVLPHCRGVAKNALLGNNFLLEGRQCSATSLAI